MLRLEREYSQEWLGEQIGVNQKMVSKYEDGTTPIPHDRMASICRALKCTPNQIFADLITAADDDFQPTDSSAAKAALLIQRLPLSRRTAFMAMLNASQGELETPRTKPKPKRGR